MENVIHDSPKQEEQLSSLAPDQRAARLKGMAVGYRYVSYSTPIIILLITAIGALVNWGSFNFGLGRRRRLRRCSACGCMPRCRDC